MTSELDPKLLALNLLHDDDGEEVLARGIRNGLIIGGSIWVVGFLVAAVIWGWL